MYRSRRLTEPENALCGYLEEARRLVVEAERRHRLSPDPQPLSAELESLRWFPLPHEVKAMPP